MNLEAENMIERFIWRRFVPGAVVVALVILGLAYFLR
jgi:hypothetical protein